MKHTPIILLTLLLGLTFFSCKKQEQEILTPKIIDDKVETTATTATFTWTVDWPGKLISVVELSENEDMSNSQYYGSEAETDNHDFTVTVTDLKVATKYYYRHVVWNKFYVDNKFEKEVNGLITSVGAFNGIFTINEVGNQVYFSRGNLQYQASTGIWRFAEHQYDCVGNPNSHIASTFSGWIDLFGWGTSGWNSGAVCYQPWSTSHIDSDYYIGGIETNDLTGSYANADWGVYNKISNGGDFFGEWRTLTLDEWLYVFKMRQASTVNGTMNARFAKANVANVRGVILFPDEYTHPSGILQLTGINDSEDEGWNENNYSVADWLKMEDKGAVFLPAAGYRYETNVWCLGSYGNYWTSSVIDPNTHDYSPYTLTAYGMYFREGRVFGSTDYRGNGQSVRLVRDAQ